MASFVWDSIKKAMSFGGTTQQFTLVLPKLKKQQK